MSIFDEINNMGRSEDIQKAKDAMISSVSMIVDMLYTYHSKLIEVGFPEDISIALTLDLSRVIWSGIVMSQTMKPPTDPEL